MQPIFGDSQSSANRTQYKIKYEVFIFIAEMQPIFDDSQSSANRTQYKIKYEVSSFASFDIRYKNGLKGQ